MIRKTFISTGYSEIILIGVGGTGGYLAQGLAKMIAGYKLDMKVTLVDPDYVEEKNCARQNFWHYEIGESKSEVLAMRLNQQYGLQFASACLRGEDFVMDRYPGARLIITCVDSVAARLPYKGKGSWLDIGNDEVSGQAIFGNSCNQDDFNLITKQWKKFPDCGYLPCPFTVAKMDKLKPAPVIASCADHPFNEQGVFVNEWAAQAGLTILFQLLIKEQLKTPHIYFNTQTGRMNPAFITKEIYSG